MLTETECGGQKSNTSKSAEFISVINATRTRRGEKEEEAKKRVTNKNKGINK